MHRVLEYTLRVYAVPNITRVTLLEYHCEIWQDKRGRFV